MQSFLFYFFSFLAISSALLVITLSRPSHALLSLIVTMFSLAVLFLQLGAPFLAMVHLIVYAGAVLVLFLFVIMLQGIGAKDLPVFERFPKTYLFGAGLMGVLFLSIMALLPKMAPFYGAKGINGGVEEVGRLIFRDYLLPFELISILLILGVVAAVTLVKKDDA